MFAYFPGTGSEEGESCGAGGVESVLMKCRNDELVLIESALLGRFNDSRCHQLTADEVECFVDIRQHLKNHFRRNHSISFKISDDFVHRMNPRCLRKQPSLRYAYQCYTGRHTYRWHFFDYSQAIIECRELISSKELGPDFF